MNSEPTRWFFVHVQKTAGTALWRRLKQQFPPESVYPGPGDGEPPTSVLTVSHLRERWGVRRDEIRVVTGHFPLCTVELLDAPFLTLTTLRDPIERTLSQLRHHRETAPEASELPLEEIYDDPVRFELLHDHMVKVFSLTTGEMTDGVMTHVETTPDRIARAKARLATVDVIGLQNRFDEFCAELTTRFGWELGPPIFMNRTAPVPVAESFRDRIRRDSAADLELFAYAEELYAARRSRD